MSAFLALIRLLTPAERRRLVLILIGITAAALIEAAGVASVVPFLTLVANSGSPKMLDALASVQQRIGIADANQFIVFVGLASLAMIVTSSVLNAVVTWAQVRFTNRLGCDLSRRLFHAYVARDHSALLASNSTELAKNVLSEIDRLVAGALTPAITLLSRIAVACAIVGLLLVVDPFVALSLGAMFGCVYVLLYLFVRARLGRVGGAAVEANAIRFRTVTETFSALRELRLYGRVGAFVQRFDEPARRFADAHASSLMIGQVPKFVLEPLAFAGVVLMVILALRSGQGLASVLPTIGLFAFGGYRLMPALQNIFLALSSIRFYVAPLEIVVREIAARPALIDDARADTARRGPARIEVDGVRHEYDGRAVLDGISLVIEPNTTVGLVGRTGSGKTTLTSLILGLLTPTGGEIRVDGERLEGEALVSWQRRLGYVPQDVFLTDDTIAGNIALGVPRERIDHAAVRRAAALAQIDDLIASLPEGYDTIAGERGGRLSGGQRQRIGIARALYHDPDVLVLDEASSGLDAATEESLMDAINGLAGSRTVIIVAHREAALRHADVVHVLRDGTIAASLPPQRLSEWMKDEGVPPTLNQP